MYCSGLNKNKANTMNLIVQLEELPREVDKTLQHNRVIHEVPQRETKPWV